MVLQNLAAEANQIAVFDLRQRRAETPDAPSNNDWMLALADKAATEYRTVTAGAEFVTFAETDRFLFVVTDGWLQRNAILEDGRRQILGLHLPGDLIVDRPSDATMVAQSLDAITNATIALIPKDQLTTLIADRPETALALLEATQDALQASYESLVDAGRRTSIEAVAHFLLRVETRAAAAIGRTAKGRVAFPLIQEQIGDATGLTAVHVCRTLRKLKTAGAIEMGRGWLRIVDRGLLADIAGADEDPDATARAQAQRLAS